MPTNKELAKDVSGLSEKIDAVVESSNEAVNMLDEKIDSKFESISLSMSELMEAIKSTRAMDNPVEIRKTAEEAPDGFEHDYRIEEGAIIKPNAQSVDDPFFKLKTDRMKFDAELILIHIEETHHDDEVKDTRFLVSVNGNPMIFEEGKEYWVPRAYVELLYRALRTNVGSREYVDQADGVKKVDYPSKTAQRYPLSIVEDKNPRGRQWRQDLMAERH